MSQQRDDAFFVCNVYEYLAYAVWHDKDLRNKQRGINWARHYADQIQADTLKDLAYKVISVVESSI
jgi:hypothetical protein